MTMDNFEKYILGIISEHVEAMENNKNDEHIVWTEMCIYDELMDCLVAYRKNKTM